MSISPQGYLMGDDPKAQNPFWGEGETDDVNRIFATAQVQGQVGDGAASVETNKTISGHNITFGFLFKNIIGKNGVSPAVTVTDITGGHRITITDATSTHTFDIMDGATGEKGDAGVSPDVSVREIVGGHIITITDATGSESFTVMNGTQGEKGDNGDTPVITITATQDGAPVTVTKTGTDTAPSFAFEFTGGGGSTGQSVRWGSFGAEVAGKYPRNKRTIDVATAYIPVNLTGTGSFYLLSLHNFDYTITGSYGDGDILSEKQEFQPTVTSTPGYVPTKGYGDFIATVTPTEQDVTISDIWIEYTGGNLINGSLDVTFIIHFTASYNGQTLTSDHYVNTTITDVQEETYYAYLEVLPEA